MHTAVVGTPMKAFRVLQAPCQLGRWIWSRLRYSCSTRVTFTVFPTMLAHARLLEWVWPLKFHFLNFAVLVFLTRETVCSAPQWLPMLICQQIQSYCDAADLTAATATTTTPIGATASGLLRLEWSGFRGRIHSIRWEDGGAPGLQYGSRLNIYYK